MCQALKDWYHDGVMEGIKQNKIDVAKNLLDVNIIAEKVGLPLDIVLELKEA